MRKRGNWRYSGVDESNNGRYPVFFISVFSNLEGDSEVRDNSPSKDFLPKKRKHDSSLWGKFSLRKYSFLLYSQSDSDRITDYKVPGIVLASLFYEEDLGRELEVFFDGTLSGKEKDFAECFVKEVTGIPRRGIEIIDGPNLDKRNSLVNIADEVAHWLYKRSIEKIRENPRMKNILKE